jgi:transposase-like protein
MAVAIVRDPIYRGRRFQSEIIELCVRWYLTYRLSYRDLVEMLAERGVVVSHTTIYRWVQQYVPEFDRRWSRYAKAVHPSWRVDETAISVRAAIAISIGLWTSLARPSIPYSVRIAAYGPREPSFARL